jgi:hypothetical protein
VAIGSGAMPPVRLRGGSRTSRRGRGRPWCRDGTTSHQTGSTGLRRGRGLLGQLGEDGLSGQAGVKCEETDITELKPPPASSTGRRSATGSPSSRLAFGRRDRFRSGVQLTSFQGRRRLAPYAGSYQPAWGRGRCGRCCERLGPLGDAMAQGWRVASARWWMPRRAGHAAAPGFLPGCRSGGGALRARSPPRWPRHLRTRRGRVPSTSASA